MIGSVDPPLPSGYQYDFINAEVLLESAFVKEGRLTLPHGTSYEALILPKLETMRPELLEKIAALVRDGAVVLGPKPTRSPSRENQPEADFRVKKIADELWESVDGKNILSKTVGTGLIASGMTMEQLFDQLALKPDCRFPQDAPLVFAHRTLEKGEIYFLANQSDKPLALESVAFRCGGFAPRLWNPLDGTLRALPVWRTAEGMTELPLVFAPRQSYFVVFDTPTDALSGPGQAGENFPTGTIVAELGGGWTVRFDASETARGPKEPVAFETLTDWTASKSDAIKYFSGTAVYEKTVTLTKPTDSARLILSLGKVAEMAKIRVNGQALGGVWTDPYELDITDAVEDGENRIEVAVVNTWMNRLIGDAKLPEQERKTWAPVNPYTADSPLKPSGLLGPVQIRKH